MAERKMKPFSMAAVLLAVILAAVALFLFRSNEEPSLPAESSLSGPAQGPGPQAQGPATEEPAPWAAQPRPQEDRVVGLAFLDALADFCIAHYHPAGSGTKSAFSATFKTLNQHFGRSLDGLSHESQEPGPARAEILDYALGPGMVRTLSGLYAEWFVEDLVQRSLGDPMQLALSDGRSEERALTRDETADLLRLAAPRAKALAATLRAVAAHPETVTSLERYLTAASKVEAANAKYQDLVTQEDAPAKARNRAAEELKKAIAAREQLRAEALDRVRAACGADCPEDGDLLYTIMWCGRRLRGHAEQAESLTAAAAALDELAGRFLAKASELEAAAPAAGN
jgi:hypothetical protein